MLQASFRKLNIEKVSWNSRLIINAVFLECGTGPPGQTEVPRQPWILPVVRSNIIRLVWKFQVLPNASSCAWRPFLSCRQKHNQENNQPIINQLTLDKENYKPGSRSFSTWTAKLKDWRATTLWQVSIYMSSFCQKICMIKHCQRHNGPEGWVLLTRVTPLSYITSSYTNLDQKSSESRPSTNFEISTKHQHFDKT